MPKNKDGSVSMTLQFPDKVYRKLAYLAEMDRRSKTQEVFHLIDQMFDQYDFDLDAMDAYVKEKKKAKKQAEKDAENKSESAG